MAWGLLCADPELVRLGIGIESAGLMAETGSPPVTQAVCSLAERGLDIRMHRARQATYAGLREAELILVMEKWQKRWIGERWPELAGRVFLLGHWDGFEIADPYGSRIEVFRATLTEIERGTRAWVSHLVRMHRPANRVDDRGAIPRDGSEAG